MEIGKVVFWDGPAPPPGVKPQTPLEPGWTLQINISKDEAVRLRAALGPLTPGAFMDALRVANPYVSYDHAVLADLLYRLYVATSP